MASQMTAYVKRTQGKLRPIFIGLLAMLFMIPLNIVEEVVSDRTVYRDEAVASVATSWAESQSLIGPILIIPYTLTEQIENFDTRRNKVIVTNHKISKQEIVIPDTLAAQATLNTELRARGLYKVPVYIADIKLDGAFSGLTKTLSALNEKKAEFGQPYISIAVTDVRGIGGTPSVTLNGESYAVEPGTRIPVMSNGLSIPLKALDSKNDKISFAMSFSLKGLNEFHLVPVGSSVDMNVKSNWPHPSFKGQFLPDTRDINAQGFSAGWKTGLLATNIGESINACILRSECTEIYQKSSGVALFQPVDIYKQSTRAVKYGMLFVALTFALFFITETMKNVKVSMPQFLLVGGALAMFFLLLVSLAEHIGFNLAYLTAASATVLLLSYYVSFVLQGKKQGLQTGAILGILYGVLYVILLSEDYALLMGSLLLFLLIAGIMVVTRNVDWENLGQAAEDKKIS